MLERQSELNAQNREGASWRDTVELDQQSVGRLSRMDAMQQQEMAQAEARRRTSDLARIEIALNRVAAGVWLVRGMRRGNCLSPAGD